MNQHTFRLKPLLDLAQIHTDAAARELGKLMAQDLEAETRLELLLEYRLSYQKKFYDSVRHGLHNTEWHNFQEFLLKLDAAIAQQFRNVSSSREKTEAGRQRYRTEQTKLDSYDVLAKRHRRKQVAMEEKREQRELDEHATRAAFHGRRPSNTNEGITMSQLPVSLNAATVAALVAPVSRQENDAVAGIDFSSLLCAGLQSATATQTPIEPAAAKKSTEYEKIPAKDAPSDKTGIDVPMFIPVPLSASRIETPTPAPEFAIPPAAAGVVAAPALVSDVAESAVTAQPGERTQGIAPTLSPAVKVASAKSPESESKALPSRLPAPPGKNAIPLPAPSENRREISSPTNSLTPQSTTPVADSSRTPASAESAAGARESGPMPGPQQHAPNPIPAATQSVNAAAPSAPRESSRDIPAPADATVTPFATTPPVQAAEATKAPASIAPEVGTREWNDALGKQVIWMVGKNMQVAELRLNPPDLGPLHITLSISNDQASAVFVSHHAAVREAVEAALPRLREMFADNSITLGQATVSADTPRQQAQFGGESAGRHSPGASSEIAATVPSSFPAGSRAARIGEGLVDTFA